MPADKRIEPPSATTRAADGSLHPSAWFIDGAGNRWELAADGNPVVNDIPDTISHAQFLELWGNTVWQFDQGDEWYSITPTQKIVTASQISWDGPKAGPSEDVRPPDPPITGGGDGPVASADFLTVDFTQAQTYAGGTAQQVVSRRMYGVSTGGAGDRNFEALANPAYQELAGFVNSGLYWFKDSGQQYWNQDLSINTSVLANLVNNYKKIDPLGCSGVAMIINWKMVPGGEGNPARYADGMASLARYLKDKVPLVLMGGYDEPDGQNEDTVANYYKAFVPKVKAVDPNILVSGPGLAYCGWTGFGSKAPIDVFSYNYFRGGYTQSTVLGESCITQNNFVPIQQQANGATGNIQATLFGGLGLDWNCCLPENNTYVGACFHAWGMIASLDNAKRPMWMCIWDAFADGTCGTIRDPNNWATPGGVMNITPKGYLEAEGVRKVYGPRWRVTKNAAGLLACAVTPATGRASLMVVNAGKGNQNAKEVALSKWPAGGNVRVWQMTRSCDGPGKDGTVKTVALNAGKLTLDFPDPSITIISA